MKDHTVILVVLLTLFLAVFLFSLEMRKSKVVITANIECNDRLKLLMSHSSMELGKLKKYILL